MDEFKEVFLPVLMLVLWFIVFVGCVNQISITYFNNVPTKVWVDNKLVFAGSSAAVHVDSGGFATTVKIYDGFQYSFPKAIYTSKDVVIEGKK